MAEESDLTFDIPDELYARLKTHAAVLSLTPEEYVRECLAEILGRPEER